MALDLCDSMNANSGPDWPLIIRKWTIWLVRTKNSAAAKTYFLLMLNRILLSSSSRQRLTMEASSTFWSLQSTSHYGLSPDIWTPRKTQRVTQLSDTTQRHTVRCYTPHSWNVSCPIKTIITLGISSDKPECVLYYCHCSSYLMRAFWITHSLTHSFSCHYTATGLSA